jgi:WD40 repeat protein
MPCCIMHAAVYCQVCVHRVCVVVASMHLSLFCACLAVCAAVCCHVCSSDSDTTCSLQNTQNCVRMLLLLLQTSYITGTKDGCHMAPICASAWTNEGSHLLTACTDGKLLLWDTELKEAVNVHRCTAIYVYMSYCSRKDCSL